MSRAIERYVCASEDRPHYNNETNTLYGFYYPMTPTVIIIHETEIVEQEDSDIKKKEDTLD